MAWNKEIVFENIKGLNETDCVIFGYVTGITIRKFQYLWEIRIGGDDLFNKKMDEFQKEFNEYPLEHPFMSVWNKIIDGAKIEKLIYFTDYDNEYKECANRINRLWNMPQYHGLVCMILKAFAERDWDELEEKFNCSCEQVQSDIEDCCHTIVDNLDTEDLKTIIKFCGGN